jgi:uncharacterized membrane protein
MAAKLMSKPSKHIVSNKNFVTHEKMLDRNYKENIVPNDAQYIAFKSDKEQAHHQKLKHEQKSRKALQSQKSQSLI